MGRIWMVVLLVWIGQMFGSHLAYAQLAEGCDDDGDGKVNGYDPSTWDEGLQAANQMNFYGMMMSYSPIQSPAALTAGKLVPKLELSYVPQQDCLERAVFDGQKTENTNKTYVLPRLRVSYGLPFGIYVGLGGVPPVTLFGVQSGMIAAEVGYGSTLREQFELGARAYVLGGRVAGDLAGPLEGQEAVDDVYRNTVYGAEAGIGYRKPIRDGVLVPYVQAGFTRIIALFYVGEKEGEGFDETDPNAATLPTSAEDAVGQELTYRPSMELGVQARVRHYHVGLEVFVAPIESRVFISPRITLGYAFF